MNDDEPTCPVCNGPLVFLGTLGTLDHYRCRNCAADSSKPKPAPETDEWGATPEDHRELNRQGIAWMD